MFEAVLTPGDLILLTSWRKHADAEAFEAAAKLPAGARLRRVAGPDPARDGVVRWRCCDLRRVIAERFDVVVHERTVGKLLDRLGLSRLKPRPHHPKRDLAAQEAFKKTFLSL